MASNDGKIRRYANDHADYHFEHGICNYDFIYAVKRTLSLSVARSPTSVSKVDRPSMHICRQGGGGWDPLAVASTAQHSPHSSCSLPKAWYLSISNEISTRPADRQPPMSLPKTPRAIAIASFRQNGKQAAGSEQNPSNQHGACGTVGHVASHRAQRISDVWRAVIRSVADAWLKTAGWA